jgi:acyl-CoA synthetase (AMP-forming)/AMP-acid ligase II
MLAKVVAIGTTDEVPVGQEGEICINGPALMLGYLDNPEETAQTLRRHADGKVDFKTLQNEELARLKAAGEYTGEASG